MQIPHSSQMANIKAEGLAIRKAEMEQKNILTKQEALCKSNDRFTEDFVAHEIMKALRDGKNSLTFKTVKYFLDTNHTSKKEEYVPFPSNVVQAIRDAEYNFSNYFPNEFVIFFTKEAEAKYYK